MTSIESLNDVAKLKINTNSDENSGIENGVSKEETRFEKEDRRYDDLYDEMIKKQRHFILDLLPKVKVYLHDSCQWPSMTSHFILQMMYSRGALIELLISSDVSRYCEFKLVTRILTIINNKFESVNTTSLTYF